MKLSKPAIIQKMSCVYNKDVKNDKNQFILFFFIKIGDKASKFTTNSLKNIKNFALIPFDILI